MRKTLWLCALPALLAGCGSSAEVPVDNGTTTSTESTSTTSTTTRPHFVMPPGPSFDPRLVAFWPLNDGSIEDATDNGHDGTNDGGELHANRLDEANSSLWLGDEARAIVPDDDALDPAGAMTVCLWLSYAESTGSGRSPIITKIGEETGSARSYELVVTAETGLVSFLAYGDNDYFQVESTVPLLADGSWCHVCASLNGEEIAVYVDTASTFVGVENGQIARSADVPLVFGRNGAYSSQYVGAIDNVMLFDVALSGDEIQEIYDDESR